MIDIKKSREICAMATPEPWERHINPSWNKALDIEPNIAFVQKECDAEFIAHARASLPEALDEIERIEKRRKAFENALCQLMGETESCCYFCIRGNKDEPVDDWRAECELGGECGNPEDLWEFDIERFAKEG